MLDDTKPKPPKIPPLEIDQATDPPRVSFSLGEVTLRDLEIIVLEQALRLYQNKKYCAKKLGISRAALYEKIKRYRLRV